MLRKHYIVLLFVVICVLIVSNTQAQCAMCKAAAESDLENNTKSIARGLNKGIIFLMIAPYIIVSFIFRKKIFNLLKNFNERRKQPFTKAQKEWLVFGISVSTIWFVLFILFLRTQYNSAEAAEKNAVQQQVVTTK